MRNIRRGIISILLCCFIISTPSPAQAQARDPVFEQEILDRLDAINPDAVPFFQQATQALDAGEYQAARTGYERVLELAPDFPDALRRISHVEQRLGLLDEALAHAQQAFDLDSSAVNKINLAEKLLATEQPANIEQALTLAKEAIWELPDDIYAYDILMLAAFLQEDMDTLGIACETLFRLVPDYSLPHYLYAYVLVEDGRWEQAEEELLKARDLGMPAEAIDQVLQETGIARQALLYRSARWSGYVVAGWLLGMVGLFLLGLLLSKVTLSAVQRAQLQANTTPSRGELRIRSVYRKLIGLVSAYFYISIPFIILILVTIGIGVVYYMIIQGRVFNRLVFFIVASILYSLYAVIRGIFFRLKQQEPGRPLTHAEAPALWKLTQEVASQLQTQPIEAIYLTPGAEIAVFEQGGGLRKTRDQGKRSLLLGLGVLSGLTQGQLKSILAHEYGHFTGKDTAGGDLAFRVRRSIQMIAFGLIASGQARWYNPAWWFVNGFFKLFQRITLGASRLQEILADRIASVTFGARSFIEGLQQVIRQSIAFNLQVNTEINQAVQSGARIKNLFTLPLPSAGSDVQKLEEAYQIAFNKPTSAYDSHPSPAERCHLVEQLHLHEKYPSVDNDHPAWELLLDPVKLQNEMTAQVQALLDKRKQ